MEVTVQQLHQGRFAGPIAADEPDAFAGVDRD
jgi:hypothetical protein